MNKLLLLPLLLFVSTLTAQERFFNTTDLSVNESELKAEVYSKDSTANAFYIYEDGYSRFQKEGDHHLLTDYKAKVKILNKEGFDQANVVIKLFKGKTGKEKISNLTATTHYLENGREHVKHLSPDKIFTEENPEYDLVKFTFPSVQPGAVLVYSYQKESPYIFNFEPWWFQAGIPKMYSRYLAEIPGNYRYHIRIVGNQKLDVENNSVKHRCFYIPGLEQPADCTQAEYVMKDIPAFKEEKFLTSPKNFISRIEYELNEVVMPDGRKDKITKSWKDVDKELRTHNNLGKQLRKTKWVKGVLPETISSQPNDLAKAQEIYDFVKKNYSWNEEYQIYRDVNIKDLLEEKTGNVSAINILLHNLYIEEGFEVFPVLSSTRENGMPTQLYPVLSDFNYLMVQLDLEGQKYLLDATEKNADFGLTPFRTLNKTARLLDFKKGSSWIEIEPQGYSTVVFLDSLKLNADGTTSGFSRHSFTGHHALAVKNKLEEITPENIFSSLTNPNSHTRSLGAIPNLEKEVNIQYQLNNGSQKINDLIYLNPFSFRFFSENPFKLKERTYPIDFGYKDAYTYNINLEIPDTHEIVELPENKMIGLPESGGTLHFMTKKVNEQTVMIHCRVNFPMAVYGAGYYPYLQKFFSEMMDIQEQSIILIREKA